MKINLCSNVDIPSECKNKNIESTSILFVSNNGDCVSLISDSKSKNKYAILNEEKPDQGLVIKNEVNKFSVQL